MSPPVPWILTDPKMNLPVVSLVLFLPLFYLANTTDIATLTIRVARNGTFHETKLREYIQYIVEFVNGKRSCVSAQLY